MVPGPESTRILEEPTSSNTEHALRFNEGTQVPEPNIVAVIPVLLEDIRFYD
jgi:hypothetical protein